MCISRTRGIFLILILLLLVPVACTQAQDGSVPPQEIPSETPADSGTGAQDPNPPVPPVIPVPSTSAEPGGSATTQTPGTLATTSDANPRPTSVPGILEPAEMQGQVPAENSIIDSVEVLEPQSESGLINLTLLIVALCALILSALGLGVYIKNAKAKGSTTQEGQCNSIRDLLEQKKRELEEMVRKYPENKVREFAKNSALGAIKRNAVGAVVLEVKKEVDDLQAKYNKLKKTIDLLQGRYDLCQLSLPSVGALAFTGTIIESSLNDSQILKNLRIVKEYQSNDWKLHDVQVNEKQIEKLGGTLAEGPWYMHFWDEKKENAVIVFRDKQFKVQCKNKESWKDAIAYGILIGIPEKQLQFRFG